MPITDDPYRQALLDTTKDERAQYMDMAKSLGQPGESGIDLSLSQQAPDPMGSFMETLKGGGMHPGMGAPAPKGAPGAWDPLIKWVDDKFS